MLPNPPTNVPEGRACCSFREILLAITVIIPLIRLSRWLWNEVESDFSAPRSGSATNPLFLGAGFLIFSAFSLMVSRILLFHLPSPPDYWVILQTAFITLAYRVGGEDMDEVMVGGFGFLFSWFFGLSIAVQYYQAGMWLGLGGASTIGILAHLINYFLFFPSLHLLMRALFGSAA